MEHARLCLECGALLTNRRSDAKTCSGKCRSRKFRSLREQSVLVPFRLPTALHVDLLLAAYKGSQGINAYLTKVVSDYLAHTH